MDRELVRMQVVNIQVLRPTVAGYTSEGDEVAFGPPITMAAHFENQVQKVPDDGGNQLQTRPFLVVTQEVFLDDLFFLPGTNVSDLNQGKKPVGSIERFYDPETGEIDHWEVTL